MIGITLIATVFFATPSMAQATNSSPAVSGWFSDIQIKLNGYLRTYLSMNLGNPPETRKNDRWDISMARGALQLEGSLSKGDIISFYAVARAYGEVRTPYLKRLSRLGAGEDESGGNLMDNYQGVDLREFYAAFDLKELGKWGERVNFRVGKQQIIWGETDFFQAMDLLQGFDFTWRSFLEGENEDLRKPLIFVNAVIQIPELNGNLQLVLRPGVDREEDIGTTYDLFGGRWANQPNKGVNFLPLVPYNYEHRSGDIEDPTWGIRWSGAIANIGYSLAYLRVFGPDPAVNSAFVPYKSIPKGSLGEFIYPKKDLFGFTANYAVAPPIDAVFSTEIAYTKDNFFNVGTDFLGGALPGFGGIKKKDTLRLMLRMDKNLYFLKPLTATPFNEERSPWFSVQIFDTCILNYKKSDDIVDLAGYGARKRKHSAIITAILNQSYMSDRLKPGIAGGYDLSYGGWFIIPSLTYIVGDHWRFNAELDLFFPDNSKRPGEVESGTHMFGYFKNNNQLFMRATYQF